MARQFWTSQSAQTILCKHTCLMFTEAEYPGELTRFKATPGTGLEFVGAREFRRLLLADEEDDAALGLGQLADPAHVI